MGSTMGVAAQAQKQEAVSPSQGQTSEPQAAQHVRRRRSIIQLPTRGRWSSVGNARFTVLTPELIRMEWAADGKFEDHASFVFINRRLPVPKFEQRNEVRQRQAMTIKDHRR